MEKKDISRRRFIRLGVVFGLGSAGAPMAAGCGVDLGSPGSRRSPTPDADAAEVGEGKAIARESELAPGSALPFADARTGRQAVLVRLKSGEFVAYSAVCTHQRCTVAYKDGKLACPCHGSVFDPTEGAAVETGPATRPLPGVKIDVRDGEVFLA